MLYGPTTLGDSTLSVAADTLLLGDSIVIEHQQFLLRIGVVIDGRGPMPGQQRIRGVVYSDGGTLVAVGQEVVIENDQPGGRVWITFDAALGRVLQPGRYRAGIQTGTVSNHARIWTSRVPSNAAVVVGPTSPTGPALWVPDSGRPTVLTDGPGGPDESDAALFVQETAPPVGGSWLQVDADDPDEMVRFTTHHDGPPAGTGDASMYVGGTRSPGQFPSVWAREEHGRLLLDVVAEPAPSAPYDDGPPENVPVEGNQIIPLLLETAEVLRLPQNVPDDHYAAMPWDITQRVFGGSSVLRSSAQAATLGWYGRSFDPTSGAHAIVRQDGPLADLLGERIRITRRTPDGNRTVSVHAEREMPDELDGYDLLVSRRAFFALANLAASEIAVTVEVLQ
jgi:hypothetical protein